jgi:hypothetical protein
MLTTDVPVVKYPTTRIEDGVQFCHPAADMLILQVDVCRVHGSLRPKIHSACHQFENGQGKIHFLFIHNLHAMKIESLGCVPQDLYDPELLIAPIFQLSRGTGKWRPLPEQPIIRYRYPKTIMSELSTVVDPGFVRYIPITIPEVDRPALECEFDATWIDRNYPNLSEIERVFKIQLERFVQAAERLRRWKMDPERHRRINVAMLKALIKLDYDLTKVEVPLEYFELPEVKRAIANRLARELKN